MTQKNILRKAKGTKLRYRLMEDSRKQDMTKKNLDGKCRIYKNLQNKQRE